MITLAEVRGVWESPTLLQSKLWAKTSLLTDTTLIATTAPAVWQGLRATQLIVSLIPKLRVM